MLTRQKQGHCLKFEVRLIYGASPTQSGQGYLKRPLSFKQTTRRSKETEMKFLDELERSFSEYPEWAGVLDSFCQVDAR